MIQGGQIMDKSPVIPDRAAIAISDMLEHCARIQPGQEVSILAHLDGLVEATTRSTASRMFFYMTGDI